jgi:tetratricopeptide (TPR) repeat protein
MTRPLAVILLLAAFATGSRAGDAAYRAGDYERAAREYRSALVRESGSHLLHYNLGVTLLRLGRYEEARRHLEQSNTADDPSLRQSSHYNSGNGALYPALRAPAGAARDTQLRTAIGEYRRALLLDPSDADAKWNLELAERLLASPPAGGGGGGGGGGRGDDDAPARPDPTPAEGDGPTPRMTPEEAERVLEAAVARDQELQLEKLRRAPASPPTGRDW